MSDFKPDRKPHAGELLKEWTREVDAATAKLRKDLTCPNCGFLMATGVPCGSPNGGVDS